MLHMGPREKLIWERLCVGRNTPASVDHSSSILVGIVATPASSEDEQFGTPNFTHQEHYTQSSLPEQGIEDHRTYILWSSFKGKPDRRGIHSGDRSISIRLPRSLWSSPFRKVLARTERQACSKSWYCTHCLSREVGPTQGATWTTGSQVLDVPISISNNQSSLVAGEIVYDGFFSTPSMETSIRQLDFSFTVNKRKRICNEDRVNFFKQR